MRILKEDTHHLLLFIRNMTNPVPVARVDIETSLDQQGILQGKGKIRSSEKFRSFQRGRLALICRENTSVYECEIAEDGTFTGSCVFFKSNPRIKYQKTLDDFCALVEDLVKEDKRSFSMSVKDLVKLTDAIASVL